MEKRKRVTSRLMLKVRFLLVFIFIYSTGNSQLSWTPVDSLFGSLPSSIRVFKSTDSLEEKPNIAFYISADVKDKDLSFTSDTALNRRLTPLQFYQKNNQPFVTVNCTFFSFATNRNISLLVKNGKTLAFNNHIASLRGKDTLTYAKFLGSAIGISKKRKADVAWIYSDSSRKWPVAVEYGPFTIMVSTPFLTFSQFDAALQKETNWFNKSAIKHQWKMETAVGGGPVLIQNGDVKITNNEERKFMGKAINDKHPRTAMGYTADGRLIILVVQGRFPGIAEGATLTQTAEILKGLGCIEALNLDGGGSSCLLVNGKETITPSDNKKQRAVPAVFMIQ
jgi:hypothetical protein